MKYELTFTLTLTQSSTFVVEASNEDEAQKLGWQKMDRFCQGEDIGIIIGDDSTSLAVTKIAKVSDW